MCGIAGIQVNPSDRELMARGRRRRLLAELLIGIESRGRDASGVAWRTPDGTVWIQKDAVPARVLASVMDTTGEWNTAIAHARFATQGSPKNNANNHPVQVDTYIGVHNGMIWNDDEIFDLLAENEVKRIAQVDTEAVFALMRYGVRAFPEYDGNRSDLLSLVEGSAALAWMLRDDPKDTLYLAVTTGSPLWVGHTPGRSVVFASTRTILVAAADRAGVTLRKITEIAPGTALKVRGGRVRSVTRFFSSPKPKPTYKPRTMIAGPQGKPLAVPPSWLDRKEREDRERDLYETFGMVEGWPAWDGDVVIGWEPDKGTEADFEAWDAENEAYLSGEEVVAMDRRLLLDD